MKPNVLGLVAGILTLFLPFAGFWWRASLGEIAIIKLSPFGYDVTILGESLSSTLVSYLLFGVLVSVFLGGVLLVIGSLFTDKWWSGRLVRFGATKVLWSAVSLICTLVIAASIFNRMVPSLAKRDDRLQFSIPYLSGSSTVEISSGDVEVRIPLRLSFTWVFWLALATGILGLVARMVQGKLEPVKSHREG